MALEITFLGTGSAFTDYRLNYHNNALVWTDEGPVLIDIGPTARQSMRELGISIHALRSILITHLHGDHIGGLEQYAWERFYTGSATGGPSWSETPVCGTERILTDLRTSFWASMDEWTDFEGAHLGGYDRLIEHTTVEQDKAFTIGGVNFAFHWTPHIAEGEIAKPSFGIQISRPGGDGEPDATCYFTSDTTFRAHIGELYPDGAIFHDCTFIPLHPGSVHSHYSQLCTLPPEVKARIVLMHHTVVPDGIDVVADGFLGAAQRHERFDWQGTKLSPE